MKEKIINALNDVKVIYDNKRLGELLRIKSVEWQESDQSYTVTIALNFESKTYNDALVKACSEAIEPLLQRGQSARFVINAKNVAHKVQNGLKPMDNIKNIIAVGSGKGGVGKSTTSINLAHALKNEGFTVGILDADIYGPSMPKMLGTNERPRSRDNKSMEPIDVDGLQTMSIGFLVDEENAMIWRAPMAVGALTQLLNDTMWRDLDYLIIDMPPGTGDIQLTLSQKIPVAGSVIVTTPQDIALIDARKGIDMFNKVDVPILGVVENMSTHVCSHCGHEEAIFGTDGGKALAEDSHVPLLGQLPLDIRVRQALDQGQVHALDASDIALRYQEIALKMVSHLSQRPKDVAGKFPKIVVENR